MFLETPAVTLYEVDTDKVISSDPYNNGKTYIYSKYDPSSFYLHPSKLSDDENYNMIKNVWKPTSDFSFPIRLFSKKKHRFNHQWLDKFPWLVYSQSIDGAFCLPCVLFGKRTGSNASKLDRLMLRPLTDWPCAPSRLCDHEMKSDIHRAAVSFMQEFMNVMENKTKPINQVHNSIIKDQVTNNRRKLGPIVKTIFFVVSKTYL